MLKRLLVSALFAGFAAGLIASALQQVFVIPVLLEAELYESGELVHFGGSGGGALEHDHDSHVHTEGDDANRALLTWGTTTATYIGFSLILMAAMVFASERGHRITPRTGLLWGLCGFIAVHLLPSIGHPPELPGNAAADLFGRQMWWAYTVCFSVVGLAALAFGRSWPVWVAGLAAILVPHIIGAPHPDMLSGAAPPEIAALFATRSLGTAAASWAALGCLAAYFWTSEDNPVIGANS